MRDRNSDSRIVVLQLVMLLWSYFSVVFTDPGGVPPNWRPTIDEERGESQPLTVPEHGGGQVDPHPKIRFCRKCNQLKPPRCHHCSVCEYFFSILYILSAFTYWSIILSAIHYTRWEVCSKNGSPLCVGC